MKGRCVRPDPRRDENENENENETGRDDDERERFLPEKAKCRHKRKRKCEIYAANSLGCKQEGRTIGRARARKRRS